MDESYHSDFDTVSKTMLSEFFRSPEKYYWTYIAKRIPPKQPVRKMLIGSAVHDILLTATDPHKCIAVYPEDCHKKSRADGSLMGLNPTKAAKFRAANPGKYCLTESDSNLVSRVCLSVYQHPLGNLIMDPGARFETPMYWECPYSKLKCRCKPDFFIEMADRVLVYDLKTTADPSPNAFRRAWKSQRYWLQDIHYSIGLETLLGKPVQFVFWAVEVGFPFRIARYEDPPMMREEVRSLYISRMTNLAARYAANDPEAWKDDFTQGTNYITYYPSDFEEDPDTSGLDMTGVYDG